jgi:hypothetical protein
MNKELKAKWVKALESGRYKQGKNRLSGGGYFCCLGVLRDIAFKGEHCSVQGDYANLLSRDIQKRAGLKKGTQNVLARMNDAGKTFKQIANWIRSNL